MSDDTGKDFLFLSVLVIITLIISIQIGSASHIPIYVSKIKDKPVEYAYIFAPDGTVIYGKQGNETQIWFTTSEIYMLEGKILIHNHPNGNVSYSQQDLEMYNKSKLLEMWVVTNTSIGKMRGTSWTIEYLPIKR